MQLGRGLGIFGLYAAGLLMTPLSGTAFAQTLPPPAPPVDNSDANGVDVITGQLRLDQEGLSIGDPESGGLTFGASNSGSGWYSSYRGTITYGSGGSSTRRVAIGKQTEDFTLVGGVYQSDEGSGSTLTYSNFKYYYTMADGKEAVFETPGTAKYHETIPLSIITSLTQPSGLNLKLHYVYAAVCLGSTGGGGGGGGENPSNRLAADSASEDVPEGEGPSTPPAFATFSIADGGSQAASVPEGECSQRPIYHVRLQSITSNSGYQLKFHYAANQTLAFLPSSAVSAWNRLTRATALNSAEEYCDPEANTCTFTKAWPTKQYANDFRQMTDELGAVTDYGGTSGVTSVTPPTSSSPLVSATYSGGKVSSLTAFGSTYGYGYADSGGNRTTTVTQPGGGSKVYVSNIASERITSATDELGRTTSYQYDAKQRVTRVTLPEGNYQQITYDSRGNITETRLVAKPGSGAADIVTSSGFMASCAGNPACNKPLWTEDALGNRTDYSYDPTTGEMTQVQLPAAAPGQPRPTIIYSYTALYGKSKNAAGTLVAQTIPIYKVTGIRSCATAATCSGSANETRITIAYEPNNLRPATITAASGNGAISSTTTTAYNYLDQVTTVDGPLSGAADTVRHYFDLKGRPRGTIGPDPDGAGPRLRSATRYNYDDSSRLIKVENGTATSQSDGAIDSISVAEHVAILYDVNSRRERQSLVNGGTTYAVTQYAYDAKGRLHCTAVRMNPSTFASLPASGCTAGTTGAHGPDRVTRNAYNLADQITTVQTASGVSGVQANEVTTAYTNNGKVDYVIDAENNRTEYSYDGHDRLAKTEYPSMTKGANAANASDYEQLTYDANGSVTNRRLRDGQTISYTYDNLNRLTYYDQPVTDAYWDLAYEYDLLGRLKKATGNGWAVNAFTYDALGRLTVEQNYNRTTYHAYDLAGRRTRLTWHDGFYVDYDYDVTGNVTAIRENGATSGVGVLASYGYDNLGRRTSITRGNGTVTSFGYDSVSRLASLTQNLAGTSHDLTLGFAYNPASQIASNTRSNDIYAWDGHYNVDRSYVSNGRNQLTSAGATALGYDGRGNLTSSGSNTYGYTVENRLRTGPGINMAYEPTGDRILGISAGGVDTRFTWSGNQMISEINASSWQIVRRYVPGSGMDEPIVWYEGSGTSDRRWLHADERGSVIAVTNSAGTAININRYDDYGIPAPGNIGRFGYTGQAWIPELGMWYYKARMYSPTLGRFMQTDPIGYRDGMNWYNYVGNDPVNRSDPLGLCTQVGDYPAVNCPPKLWSEDYNIIPRGWSFENFGRDWDGGGGFLPKPPPPPPPAAAPQKESKPCDAGWNQFGERLAETGEFLENAGLTIAGVGAVTGVGAAGGLFVTAIGDVIQLGGHGIRFLAGNEDALGDAAISLIPGPKAIVPKSLRNEAGDVASDVAYGKGVDAARPGNTGC